MYEAKSDPNFVKNKWCLKQDLLYQTYFLLELFLVKSNKNNNFLLMGLKRDFDGLTFEPTLVNMSTTLCRVPLLQYHACFNTIILFWTTNLMHCKIHSYHHEEENLNNEMAIPFFSYNIGDTFNVTTTLKSDITLHSYPYLWFTFYYSLCLLVDLIPVCRF